MCNPDLSTCYNDLRAFPTSTWYCLRAYGYTCNLTWHYLQTNPPPLGMPSSVTWQTRADFNASLYGALSTNASREANLTSVLRQVRDHPEMKGFVLDFLWRWHDQLRGGDLVVDVSRQQYRCSSAPGVRSVSYAPEECRPSGGALLVLSPSDSPTYQALREWLAAAGPGGAAAATATVGSLPRTADEAPPAVPAPPECGQPCVYGNCLGGRCVCWAGASSETCETLDPSSTPASCNPRVGINLEGIADWSRSWTFVDVFKASRAWIPQTFTGKQGEAGAGNVKMAVQTGLPCDTTRPGLVTAGIQSLSRADNLQEYAFTPQGTAMCCRQVLLKATSS